MRSKPCADDAPDGTEGYSRVLRGTQGYSAAGRHPCNHFERGPCTVRDAVHTFNQRCAPSIVQTTRRKVLTGTQGVLGCWMASMQQAKWLVQQPLRACRVASASVRQAITRRDIKMEDQLVPSGAIAYPGLCLWHGSSPQCTRQGERRGPVGHSCAAAAHGVANGARRHVVH